VLQGKTVTLKIKTVTFEVHTRAQTVTQHTNDARQINLVASRLLRTEIDNVAPNPLELRLMGKHLVSLDPVVQHATGSCNKEVVHNKSQQLTATIKFRCWVQLLFHATG